MIAIIAGFGANIASVQFALARLGAESELTVDPAVIKAATHVILPGVGRASQAMATLKDNKLDKLITELKQPVLGICLGMQILFEHSLEDDVDCLGLLPGVIKPLPKQTDLTLPHMGWNQLQLLQSQQPLLNQIAENSYCYFVHSFAAPLNDSTIAVTNYGEDFASIVQQDNFYGMQFHPEKSAEVGAQLLQNFINLEQKPCHRER